jgi:hypothetical protein
MSNPNQALTALQQAMQAAQQPQAIPPAPEVPEPTPEPPAKVPVGELSAKRTEEDIDAIDLPWCAHAGEIALRLGCTVDQARNVRDRAKGKKGDRVIFYARGKPICVGSWQYE